MFVYLDNSATTKPHEDVIKEVRKMMEEDFGNPSSLHSMGVTAERAVKKARKAVAGALRASEKEIYFTCGGTEGNNAAIFGSARARRKRGKRIITSRAEHASVLEAFRCLEGQGFVVDYLDVDEKGSVPIENLENALRDDTILVSLMVVNNELGTISPIKEYASLIKSKSNGIFHCDAVQALGKIPFEPECTGVDLAVISGHKVHGPKGTGAIYINRSLTIPPLLYGGGQEAGFRSGTENVPGIAGFGIAVDNIVGAEEGEAGKLARLRRRLLEGLRAEVKDIIINSYEWAYGERDGIGLSSPAILNVSFLGCPGEALLHSLEQRNIYVSTGAACSSRKKGSHVLASAGLSEEVVSSAIRFSFCAQNKEEEVDYVVEEIKQAVNRIRKVTRYKGERRFGR